MLVPKLTPAQKTSCKACLAELDRARGSFALAAQLGADMSEPMRMAEQLRKGVDGVLQLSQTTLADLEMVESGGPMYS